MKKIIVVSVIFANIARFVFDSLGLPALNTGIHHNIIQLILGVIT